ncbi:nuclear pore complex protein GP210 isoform X1 [Humulus lupulus]|uniref:nuclear pore complex protein GP210 isoform X1 n=1 Tax=Humulus lupulus TaxID=3486 RepID=UPI002B40398A|nr:nuclear pore complex protein GP210 isoform X1 [Humulus lupulus]
MILKMLKNAVLLCCLLVFFASHGETASHLASGPHITDVNILLPPRMTHPVEYKLQGSDGCFKWSWDHHDILSVIPEYNSSNHCSTSARLRSIASYSGRKETAVYAADVHTGTVIRCKVFIDKFSRIQIFHNSVKLDLDGLATLRVRAFDSEENVFSSLVGLQFMWQLRPERNELPNHLVHVPLKDSPLSDCGGFCGDLDKQIKLEDSGVFSDLYVVKGIEIGHEIVSVNLFEPTFEHMADKIILTVAEAMSIEPPSPVFVLTGAVVSYRLKVICGNNPQVVSLPSPHHRWSVSNSSVAKVDSMMGSTNALHLGVTNVVVEDTRVAGHIQLSSLNVILPDFISLYMLPLSTSGHLVEGIEAISSKARWHVVSGCQYLIQIRVFSQGSDAQEIYITESDDINLYDDHADNWNIFPVSDNIASTYGRKNSRILKATSQGLGKLTATLNYFSQLSEMKEILKVGQEVMVCDQVKFHLDKRSGASQSIILPWAPSVFQEVELKASGGCAKASKDYKWFSSDISTISVSTSGVVQAKKPGKATIRVLSIFDSFNYDEVIIEVSIPSSIVMLRNFPVETVVGSYIQAAVTLKAPNGAYFYRCDAFNSFIKWKAGSEFFIVGNTTKETPPLDVLGNADLFTAFHGPPCSWKSIYASRAGRDLLHASFSKEYDHFDSSFHGPIVLKASSRIAAYPPLIIHQAGDGNQFGGYWFDLDQAEAGNKMESLDKLFLAPKTYLDVILVGGPEQWDKNINSIERVDILNKEYDRGDVGVHVHKLSGDYRSLYRVSCQVSGRFEVSFERGNLVADDHPLPVLEKNVLSLICSIPDSIAVIADEPVNGLKIIRTAIQADRSSERIRSTPITVANGRTIRLAAVGISNTGEAFANSSSIHLRWQLSSCDGLAYWDDTDDYRGTKYNWERFLHLQNESGLCIVRAIAVHSGDSIGENNYVKLHENLENVLTDGVRLQLVSTLRVSPEFNLLFFNPNAKVNLSTTGGSCFLEAFVNDTQVVEVVQPPTGLQCLQLILFPKGLGTAVVTVYDIGLTPPLTASAVVQVVDVDWIKIISQEEISLVVGSSWTIDLMAGINDGSAFDSSQFAFMNIQVHIEDPIVGFVGNDDILSFDGGYLNAPKFEIMAKHLGITTLHVTAVRQSRQEILSQPIKIEVYAPPRIHPHDIFLAPGAYFVLTVEGGPTIGVSSVEYTSNEDGIATIQKSSGRLSAVSPGNTTIIASVFGNGGIVICQAYGSVKVGLPSSVLLNVQSEQLAVGREMPIYPLFSEGDLFSFYELCRNYQWTVEDEKVLSFYSSKHLNVDKHTVRLTTPEKVQLTTHLSENELGFINVLYGRSAGRTKITVSFSCEFKTSKSKLQTKNYNASVSVLVVPELPLALGVPITWILPPHYTTKSLLPSSSESYSQWDNQSRKGTILYSLLRSFYEKSEVVQKDAISIDGDRIRTTECNNIACIQAKDRTTGRTEVAACIKVVEVAQIRAANEEFPFHVINLAVGSEISLPVTYRDSLGNPFYEAHGTVLFEFVTNYPDVVFINKTQDGSGNIYIKAIRHGRALLRISIDNIPQKSDYVLVSCLTAYRSLIAVGAHIHPQNPVLPKGSRVNFSVEGINDHVPGHWVTSNSSVISVNMLSGISEAVGEGTTQVYFEASNLNLQTSVTVLSRDVSVDAPKEMLTNVPSPAKGYSFLVKFSTSNSNKAIALGDIDAIAYDCRVNPSFLGYAKPWLDLSTGNSYCLFFPYSPEHLVHLMPKTNYMKPEIPVSVHASLREAEHIQGSAFALFIGGFSMLEMDELKLTADSNKTVITILGNTDVDIYWHERDLLIINLIHKEDFGSGSRAQYEIKVLGSKKFKDKITISLPANGQKLEVDVSYEPGERGPLKRSINISLWASVLGCVAVLALTLAIFICFLDKPGRSQAPSPPPPSFAAPVTPDRSSSPTVSMDQSPKTPQPFMEYVRRTIDETPYYRRDRQQRFNPQNTY